MFAATILAWLGAEESFAGTPTLGSAAAPSGRYFGAALDPGFFDETAYRKLAEAQLTSVTPENAMKWGPVEPAARKFRLAGRGRGGRLRQSQRPKGPRPHARLA